VTPSYLRNNVRLLNHHDEEYHRIAYQLQASLSSITVKVLSVHAIASPQQDAAFEAKHTGFTVLDSWVDGRYLPEENSIHNIIYHGGRFRITDPNKGAIFSVGSVQLEAEQAAAADAAATKRYEFLYCRVATGRSFVVDPEKVGERGIPSGYDTMVINQPPTDDADPKQYFREYVVNDETLVHPAFVVNFEFNLAADPMKTLPNCEACDLNRAVVYCMQDNAKLCEVCDREMHSKSRIYQRHQRVALNEMQSTVGLTMCKEHQTMPVQFFDPVTHEAVCIQCKMVGSHSHGENANHQLVPISDAYQSSMDDLERERQIVDERKQTIAAQATSIERRMGAVRENHEKCQVQMYEICQQAIHVLHDETQSKLCALLSDEAELHRQREYYTWMDQFLNDQKSWVNPIEFLQQFKSHSAILAKAPSEIVDGAINVRADLCVVGNLDIAVDDANAAPPANPRAAQVSEAASMQPRGLPQPQTGTGVPERMGGNSAAQRGGFSSNAQPRFGGTAQPQRDGHGRPLPPSF
jgi:hypothetical protein